MAIEYSRPEDLGISPSTLHRFLDACEEEIHSLHSFTIVKGNKMAAMGYYKPMEPKQMKVCHSISKSLNALAVGIAIGDGKLGLDDYMVKFFPEDIPEVHDERIERIRVRDLLRMAASSAYTSASFVSASSDTNESQYANWRSRYLSLIPYAEPGTWFSYDTGASYMLSCLVTKTMGKNSLKVLEERVFPYMGIEKADWIKDLEGNCTGGWGCYLRSEDIAKLGRLFLDSGKWEHRQLVPEWFMKEAVKKQIETYQNPGMGWPYGYGYQFWRYPEDTFGCFGVFGQLIVCDPKHDIIVTTTGGCTEKETQRLLHIITETVIAEAHDGPVAREDETYRRWRSRTENLQLQTAEGARESELEEKWLGKTYSLQDNPTGITKIRIERNGKEELRLKLFCRGREVTVGAGYQKWITQEAPLDTAFHTDHSFSFGWVGADCLILRHYLCNSSYNRVYKFVFSMQQKPYVQIKQNVTLYNEKELCLDLHAEI